MLDPNVVITIAPSRIMDYAARVIYEHIPTSKGWVSDASADDLRYAVESPDLLVRVINIHDSHLARLPVEKFHAARWLIDTNNSLDQKMYCFIDNASGKCLIKPEYQSSLRMSCYAWVHVMDELDLMHESVITDGKYQIIELKNGITEPYRDMFYLGKDPATIAMVDSAISNFKKAHK